MVTATSNVPVRITLRNNLPLQTDNNGLPVIAKSISIDQTLPMWNGAMDVNNLRSVGQPPIAMGWNRLCLHLHGNFSPWISDGNPFQDFDPNGGYGFSSYQNGVLLIPPDMAAVTPPGSFSYYHPNQQTARFIWLHDHAMDITRLNVYAGLATGYVLTDSSETALAATGVIPTKDHTIYLVIQDKSFNGDGTLWYPSVYEADLTGAMTLPGVNGPNPIDYNTPGAPLLLMAPPVSTFRWPWAGPPADLPPTPVSLVPEAFFDTIVINGCATATTASAS